MGLPGLAYAFVYGVIDTHGALVMRARMEVDRRLHVRYLQNFGFSLNNNLYF
jgi:hypothetical protein